MRVEREDRNPSLQQNQKLTWYLLDHSGSGGPVRWRMYQKRVRGPSASRVQPTSRRNMTVIFVAQLRRLATLLIVCSEHRSLKFAGRTQTGYLLPYTHSSPRSIALVYHSIRANSISNILLCHFYAMRFFGVVSGVSYFWKLTSYFVLEVEETLSNSSIDHGASTLQCL